MDKKNVYILHLDKKTLNSATNFSMIIVSMSVKKLLFFSALFFTGSVTAQDNFKPYTQNIEGTTLSFTMEAIPGGEYTMGSSEGNPDEQPVHRVKIDPFWMGTYEVTWNILEPFVYKDFERTKSGDNIPPEV